MWFNIIRLNCNLMEERERNSIYSSTIATHILERENQFTVQIQNISIKKKKEK